MSILGSLLSPEHNKRIKSPLRFAAPYAGVMFLGLELAW